MQNIRFNFATYESSRVPDPCFVRDHTTWMTASISAQMTVSHTITEEFIVLIPVRNVLHLPNPKVFPSLIIFVYLQ